MTLVHTVILAWKPTASEGQIKEALNALVALKENCINPTTNQPYILSFRAGANDSPEGLSGPYTHGFVVEFESAEDRNYYVTKDPAHMALVSQLKEIMADVKVLDFLPGIY